MSVGMSADEFWHGDFRLARAYREADRIRRENRYAAEWRAGVYTFEALLTASPAFRELSKGIEHEYPSAPIFSTVPRKRGKTEEERQERRMMEMMEAFKAMAEDANARLAARRASENGD